MSQSIKKKLPSQKKNASLVNQKQKKIKTSGRDVRKKKRRSNAMQNQIESAMMVRSE